VSGTSPLCELSSVALGRLFPSCIPALVQLSFSFAPGLDNESQDAFALAAAELTDPTVELLSAVARADELALAGNDLSTAAGTLAQDLLDAEQSMSMDDPALDCAADAIAEMESFLGATVTALEDRRAEAQMILDTMTLQ